MPSCELFSPEQCIDEQPVGIEFEDDCNFQLTFTFDRPSRQIRIRFDNHDEDLIVFQDVPLTSELELYPVVDIYDSSVSVTLMDN